jgi:hypothetical protein
VIQYILVIIVKAILGLILDRVSPEVKKAMEGGMDKVSPENRMDTAVVEVFNQHWTADRPYNPSLDGP